MSIETEINKIESSAEMMQMAASCTRNLLKLCGGDEAVAEKMLTERPVDIAQMLIEEHMKQMKAMKVSVHMNQERFAHAVYDALTLNPL